MRLPIMADGRNPNPPKGTRRQGIYIAVATIAFLLCFVLLFAWLKPQLDAADVERHERYVTLCTRAYGFSRDRCEFIWSTGKDLGQH